MDGDMRLFIHFIVFYWHQLPPIISANGNRAKHLLFVPHKRTTNIYTLNTGSNVANELAQLLRAIYAAQSKCPCFIAVNMLSLCKVNYLSFLNTEYPELITCLEFKMS